MFKKYRIEKRTAPHTYLCFSCYQREHKSKFEVQIRHRLFWYKALETCPTEESALEYIKEHRNRYKYV